MRRGVSSIGAFAFLLAACGAQDSAPTPVPEQEDETPPVVRIDWGTNTCPDFTSFSLEPHDIGLHTPGTVTVVAEDYESDEIFYYWSASSGKLTDTTTTTSVYRCTEVGPQTLSVVATDPDGCSQVLHIYVTCLED